MLELWLILTILSAVFYAAADILSKKLLTRKVSSIQMIFEEFILLFLLLLIFFYKKIDFYSLIQIWDLYLLKVLMIFGFRYFYYKLLKSYEISLVAPLLNLSPVFLIIFASIFLAETISGIQLLGIFIIILATYFLEMNLHVSQTKKEHKVHFNKLKNMNWKMIGIVFLMLILISICAMADKLILNEVNVFSNLFFTAFLIILGISIYDLKEKSLFQSIEIMKKEPQILFVSLLHNLSSFFIVTAIALPTAMVSLIVPIKRTSTLFSSLFGGVLFHEKHLLKKLLAIAGMLIGIILIAL